MTLTKRNQTYVIINQGIESENGKRYEAGPSPVSLAELKQHFYPKMIVNWLERGIIEVAE